MNCECLQISSHARTHTHTTYMYVCMYVCMTQVLSFWITCTLAYNILFAKVDEIVLGLSNKTFNWYFYTQVKEKLFSSKTTHTCIIQGEGNYQWAKQKHTLEGYKGTTSLPKISLRIHYTWLWGWIRDVFSCFKILFLGWTPRSMHIIIMM